MKLTALLTSISITILLGTSIQADGIFGPVLPEAFPDPTIIKVNETYYAFSSRDETKNTLINTPIASSKSFQSGWHIVEGDAIPHAGSWTESPNAHVLTPDVNQLDDGSFIMYYIAIPKSLNQKQHCVGAATSPKITGPYKPQSSPILCPTGGQGVGTADPNGFTYKNQRYLVFKNASGHDSQRQSYIAIEKVAPNGYAPTSRWTDLINSTHTDGNDVEGAVLVQNPTGGFVLFYTVGTFNTTNLRIEYATTDQVLGPYETQGVLLTAGTYGDVEIVSPVGLDVVAGNVSEAVFEAFGKDGVPPRRMYTAVLLYNGKKVSVA